MGKDGVTMTVLELARATGATADAVRYYARMGMLRPTRDPDNGYRRFGHADAVRVVFIRRARKLGYRLDEIAELLEISERGQTPCPRAREILARRVHDNRESLEQACELQERIELALRAWRELPDAVPIGDSICHLIESVTPPR